MNTVVEYAECQECGGYCCAAYDITPLCGNEIQNISDYLGLSEAEFRAQYVNTHKGHDSKLEFLKMPCPLQIVGRCGVHPVKPKACALYNPETFITSKQALDSEGWPVVSCSEHHKKQAQLKKEEDSK